MTKLSQYMCKVNSHYSVVYSIYDETIIPALLFDLPTIILKTINQHLSRLINWIHTLSTSKNLGLFNGFLLSFQFNKLNTKKF